MTYQIQLKNCLKDIESEKERKDNENMRIDRQVMGLMSIVIVLLLLLFAVVVVIIVVVVVVVIVVDRL